MEHPQWPSSNSVWCEVDVQHARRAGSYKHLLAEQKREHAAGLLKNGRGQRELQTLV